MRNVRVPSIDRRMLRRRLDRQPAAHRRLRRVGHAIGASLPMTRDARSAASHRSAPAACRCCRSSSRRRGRRCRGGAADAIRRARPAACPAARRRCARPSGRAPRRCSRLVELLVAVQARVDEVGGDVVRYGHAGRVGDDERDVVLAQQRDEVGIEEALVADLDGMAERPHRVDREPGATGDAMVVPRGERQRAGRYRAAASRRTARSARIEAKLRRELPQDRAELAAELAARPTRRSSPAAPRSRSAASCG